MALSSAPPINEIAVKIKAGWGAGSTGVALLMNGISFLVLFYMINILKIEPAVAGTIVFITKIFDVVTDPFVGMISDRTRHRLGRRRPFLLFGAFLSSLSFLLIFSAPQFEQQAFTVAYMFVVLIVYTIGYTVFNVPYMSIAAEMTDSYHERSSIHSYRAMFYALGTFLATGIAPVALSILGEEEWSAYALVAAGASAIILLSMLTAFFATANVRYTERSHERTQTLVEFTAVLRNQHFVRLIWLKFFQLFGVASLTSALLFLLVGELQLDIMVLGPMGAVYTVAAILSAPWLTHLSKRIGKRQSYYISSSCFILVSLSWLLAQPGEPLWALVLRYAFIGVSATGSALFGMSMLADTIEYDARATGARREGVYTSIYSLTEKFTAAFGPLVVGVAMSLAGFDRSLAVGDQQGEAVRQALLLGVAYIPAAAGIIAIFILAGYGLSQADVEHSEKHSDPGSGSSAR